MSEILLTDAWKWLLAIAAAIVSFSKAWEIISKHLHPEADLRQQIRDHAGMLDNDNRRINRLERQIEEDEEFDSVMCTVMFALLNHMLSGNDVEKLKNARDDLQRYMSRRGK